MSDRPNGLFRRLTGSWVAPGVVLAAWMVWAYLRSYPRGAAVKGGVLLRYYGLWSIKRFSYSDVLLLYRVHHLANHAAPYVHTTIEYPVLTGLFMWTAAWFHGVQGYFLASSVGLGLCCGLARSICCTGPTVGRLGVRPQPAAARLLPSQLGPVRHISHGGRLDRLAVPTATLPPGIMFAMAVWAKLFPVCSSSIARSTRGEGGASRDVRGVVRLLSAAAVTTLVINLPFALVNFKGWSRLFQPQRDRRGGDGVLFELRTRLALEPWGCRHADRRHRDLRDAVP